MKVFFEILSLAIVLSCNVIVTIFFSISGGNVIKVWDALAGGKLITTLCNHHKTVTTLSFCKNYQRLISGSIDR